jgi:hypothetical protein
VTDPFQQLIERYLYESFPLTPAGSAVRFEAISAAVLGTKQRRVGPALPPEAQVKVREVIRSAERGTLEIFSPWGASKQDYWRGLDVAEVSAVKQLACLGHDLARYGQDVRFSFRLEDHTDRYLLGDTQARRDAIGSYVTNFTKLTSLVLPGSQVLLESDATRYEQFRDTADGFFEAFLRHVQAPTDETLRGLKEIGWQGTIPEAQRRYYADAYKALGYHEGLYAEMTAKYFAATLARVKLGAVRAPKSPFVLVAFTHPVPENPVGTPRVHYRTIPERFTHAHKSPWLARGYLRVAEDGTVTPRFADEATRGLVPNTINWHGVRIETDYQQV